MQLSLKRSKPESPLEEMVAVESDVERSEEWEILESLSRSQAIIKFTPDGQILDANTNFLATLGYDLSEVVGHHHRMFVDPSYAESAEYLEFWAGLRRGEFRSAEFRRLGKGGKEIWIQATYNPVLDRNGDVSKVVKFATDITRRKQSELEIQNRSQAVIEFHTDGTIITANDLFLRTVGYALSEIQGQHHRIFMPPGEADTDAYQQFWPALARGEFRQGEFERRTKSGDVLWLQGVYNPVLSQDGQVVGVKKSVANITGEVHARNKASQIGSTIAHSVTEMTGAISEIAQSVSRTATLAQNAQLGASGASNKVTQLSDSGNAIGQVVQVIQGLSEQTNLLALNATIESARAGEAGKGFAVVANEVKLLATQTGDATDDIRASVDAIQREVEEMVQAIEEIVEAVTEVSDNTTAVSAAVEEQSVLMDDMNNSATELTELTERS